MSTADLLDELSARLDRYPAERYPVQHATAQFHLGSALAGLGRLDEARRALTLARTLFAADRMPVEHAKVRNALGALARMAGRLDEAEAEFSAAAQEFARQGLRAERGAAEFNLGLLRRDRHDDEAALPALRLARELFDPHQTPAESAAAAREIAACLLTLGRPDEAKDLLAEAAPLAARAGDAAGFGAIANLSGLAALALDDPPGAVESLTAALAAQPRSVRPAEHAMVKANLALAHERGSAPARARLAAAQALAVPEAAEPVKALAAAILSRVGASACALPAVLDETGQDHWPALLRDELTRWADLPDDTRADAAAAWVAAVTERPTVMVEWTHAWLGALLELPGPVVAILVGASADGLAALARDDHDTVETFREVLCRAMVRFPDPQWMRLRGLFTAAATERGLAGSWG